MKLPGSLIDTFSPYLDMDPVVDFFDDIAQRYTSVFGIAVGIHIALFFLLQPSFVMPDLKPDEPESIQVQIVAFEDLQAEPEPQPEEIEIRPATPAQAPPPPPQPAPTPPPPPPPPPQEPEPEPEFIPPPPPPEIIAQEAPAPEAIPMPAEIIPPPEPLPEPIVEPQPAPIFEPLPPPPEPIIEIWEPLPPLPEPIPEPLPEPIPEPIPEPELPPEIIIETPVEPQPGEWRPYVRPEPIVTPPTPGPIIEEPLPELPNIEELPPIPTPTPAEPVLTPPTPTPTPSPDPVPADEAPIVTTAPSILASPDAPTTSEESERAVPQSQSNPMNDFLFRGGPKPGSNPGSSSSPSTSLSNPSTSGTPSAGGTRRTNPGASGWTLAPGSGTSPGKGYESLVLDIRCREAGKTHLECPEYLRKHRGRNAAGWEAVGAHSSGAPQGTRSPRAGTYRNPSVGGGTDPWARGIGNNSINNGGPSTTVLDDADFGREFLGTNLGNGSSSGGRIRDIFKEPENEWGVEELTLPPPPKEEDE